MATATVDDCQLCTNSFDSDIHRSVLLPCGHNFCLLCLVRLEVSGKHSCPTCRRDWAGFDVPALPGMKALAMALQTNQEEEGDKTKEKGKFVRCETHDKPHEYWAVDIKELYCPVCIVENPPTKLKLIENAIPEIKAAIALDVPDARKKVDDFMVSLDEAHAELIRKWNSMKEFMQAVQTINGNFKQKIQEIVSVRSTALSTAAELNNIEKVMNSFNTAADVHLVVKCKSILKKVAVPSIVPSSDLPRTLLCNIACSYVDESVTANPPSKTSFVHAVQNYGPKPSAKTLEAAKKLMGGEEWTVDNNNCEAALLALADRQPSVLTLVARADAHKALPVAKLTTAAKGAEVRAKFVDTFFSATNSTKDSGRLVHLTANQSLCLTLFIGHLDHSVITKLPHTISFLGLAIGSVADAAAVSGLLPWKELKYLCVSVSSRVAAGDLKPLPRGPGKVVHFPFLSDARVDSVRPAIEALAPDLRIFVLVFPKSQLTAAGASQLAQQLQGLTVSGITLESSATWRPGVEEKTSVEAKLRSATGCDGVGWDMNFIYS